MKLVDVLASGVAGAEGGTVDIYLRGTTTRAQYFTDFEGDSGITPSSSLDLDSHGGIVVFVNQFCDIVVRDVDGNIVRDFVAGEAASAVEVNSVSFTGVDYEDGSSGASKPVPLSTVLDRLKTSTGSIDFNVLVGGVATSLQSAIANIGGLFFNVKSTAYGATGDGVADDTSAIAAAVTAATAAGGGVVFFPPGTYRITSALVPGAKVSFLGCGPSASIVTIDHATANAFTFSNATSVAPQVIRGLRVTAAQANSGNHLDVSSAVIVLLRVEDCYIGGVNTNGKGVKVATAGAIVYGDGTTFEVGGSTAIHISITTATTILTGCRFVIPATFNSQVLSLAAGGNITACHFLNATVTAGTYIDIYFSSTPTYGATVTNCYFPNAGGATVTAISSTGVRTWENGCTYGSTVVLSAPGVAASAATHEGAGSDTRDYRRYYVASDAATLTIDPNVYGVLEVERTNNGACALTLTTPTRSGLYMVLIYNNDHAGGGGTITWTGAVEPAAATFAVNANKVTYHWLQSVETKQGNMFWAQYGTLANQTP